MNRSGWTDNVSRDRVQHHSHIITESKELVEKTKDDNINSLAEQALQGAQQVVPAAIDT